MTLTVADTEELRAAQREPGELPLAAGADGRLVRLFHHASREQQDHHIRRQEGALVSVDGPDLRYRHLRHPRRPRHSHGRLSQGLPAVLRVVPQPGVAVPAPELIFVRDRCALCGAVPSNCAAMRVHTLGRGRPSTSTGQRASRAGSACEAAPTARWRSRATRSPSARSCARRSTHEAVLRPFGRRGDRDRRRSDDAAGVRRWMCSGCCARRAYTPPSRPAGPAPGRCSNRSSRRATWCSTT